MNKHAVFGLLLLLACGIASAHSRASTAELATVEAQVQPAGVVVPGQRVRLLITVGTPRWFTAGTRLSLPEVPGLILLQNQDFASNATERRGDESWSLQRWTIDLFATRPGQFQIPPVEVSVAVAASASQTRQMTLSTPSLPLTVTLPEALQGIEHWVASPSVTLEQTIAGDGTIFLGDAIKRQITVKAKDVVAMLLPELDAPTANGLQRYPEPPVLRNRANRGSLQAERRDRATWIAERPGQVELPGVQVHWWNTDTDELIVLTTDAVSAEVSGELPPTPLSPNQLITRALWGLAILSLALLAVWLYRRGIVGKLFTAGRQGWKALQRGVRALRSPALPDRLNPGGTRGVSSATSQHEP